MATSVNTVTIESSGGEGLKGGKSSFFGVNLEQAQGTLETVADKGLVTKVEFIKITQVKKYKCIYQHEVDS